MGAPLHFLFYIGEILSFVIILNHYLCCLFLVLVKLIKIQSPMQADPNRVIESAPSHGTIRAARTASDILLR